MAGEMRCPVFAAAPADTVEVLPGFVDRVGRPREATCRLSSRSKFSPFHTAW